MKRISWRLYFWSLYPIGYCVIFFLWFDIFILKHIHVLNLGKFLHYARFSIFFNNFSISGYSPLSYFFIIWFSLSLKIGRKNPSAQSSFINPLLIQYANNSIGFRYKLSILLSTYSWSESDTISFYSIIFTVCVWSKPRIFAKNNTMRDFSCSSIAFFCSSMAFVFWITTLRV